MMKRGLKGEYPNFVKIICSGTHKRPISAKSGLEARTTTKGSQ
jgi:hypothetical protein